MATQVDSGTKAADGSEQTLTTQNSVATYVLLVDTTNMVDGDAIELRAKIKVNTAASNYRLADVATIPNAQSRTAKLSIPYLCAGVTFTLKQTAGTNRNYDWGVFSA